MTCLAQWDLNLDRNHSQPHCVDYFSLWDFLSSVSAHWACVCVKRLTTIFKYKLNRENFLVSAASWTLSQGKLTFIYLESNSIPVASKEFRKVFLSDQTKTFVDIISIPFAFTSFSFHSAMTVACSWIWKELKASRTDIFQTRLHQSLNQYCEPPFHVRHLEAKW